MKWDYITTKHIDVPSAPSASFSTGNGFVQAALEDDTPRIGSRVSELLQQQQQNPYQSSEITPVVEATKLTTPEQSAQPTQTSSVNLGNGSNWFGSGKYSDGYRISRPTDGIKREYVPLKLQDPTHTQFALEEAKRLGIDPKWMTGLIMAESSGKMLGPNSANAMGYMQVTPGVGKMYTKATGQKVDLMNPYDNIKVGLWDMNRLSKMYNGDIALASAAYNAGEGAVDKWMQGKPRIYVDKKTGLKSTSYTLPKETQQYVPRVFAFGGMV